MADSEQEADAWKKSICKSANIQVGKYAGIRSSDDQVENKESRSVVKKVKHALRSKSKYLYCKCTSVEQFKNGADVSSLLLCKLDANAPSSYILAAGSVKDIIFWILYHHPGQIRTLFSLPSPFYFPFIHFFAFYFSCIVQLRLNCRRCCSAMAFTAPLRSWLTISKRRSFPFPSSLLNHPQFPSNFAFHRISWEYFRSHSFPPEIGISGMRKRFFPFLSPFPPVPSLKSPSFSLLLLK